jgi:hypothetical protein
MWGEGSLVQALFFRTLLIKDFSCGLFFIPEAYEDFLLDFTPALT